MIKRYLILTLTLCLFGGIHSNAQTWTQVGADIDGEAVDDWSGRSLSLSSDGNTVAIGAWHNDGNGSNAGHVRIYNYINGTWTQVGADIDGEAAVDFSGVSVSLSSDGSTVAIGAYYNDGNGSKAGHVRIYKNINGSWTQVGSDIDGEAAGDFSGESVSLSSDGSTVAIGARKNYGNAPTAGHVRIYKNTNGTWTQQGADIDGEAFYDESGSSVSLSSDGSTVAIGAWLNDGNAPMAGHVRIYENISGTWTQVGSDIDGEALGDQSGVSVSLSSAGSTVAIGAWNNDGNGSGSGHVRVYNNVNGTWTQVGADIDGEAAGDRSGHSVSLSSDGNTVAIGAYSNNGNGSDSGHVRIYKNTNGTWTQQGADIDGEYSGDESGSSVSLSSDGSTVAIGAPWNPGNGSNSGHVRIYRIAYTITDTITSCGPYTWIDGVTYTSSNYTATDTLVSASGYDSIVSLHLTINSSNTGIDLITACDSYTWIDGNTYTANNNTATYTLTNAAGCDSVVTLDLTINSSNTGTDVITACDSYTWIDGNTYTASNTTATHTLTNAAGCDSIVTLNLTINSSNTGTDVITACDSYTWIDGNTYTTSNNTATYTLTNAAGCDSVVSLDLNLTINSSNTGTDVITACDSHTWIDGNTYTANNNTATYTLTNVAGCDSVVTLDLTINSSSTGTDVITACDAYTWIDGNTYTASNNTATYTLTNTAGCDSLAMLDLTINGPDYIGADTINVCQESNSIYFTPEFVHCDGCAISFPNAASGLDSVALTIVKDTLYTFSYQNNKGCSGQQSIWFDYHLTPTIATINNGIEVCIQDSVSIGFQTNGTIDWLSHAYQGSIVSVSPTQHTTYLAQAISTAGCVSNIDSINVTVQQLPVITLQDSNYVCVGLTEELVPEISGNGGYHFSWSSGESTQNIVITDVTASYTLTVTDINGCSETHTVYNHIMDYEIDAGVNDSICIGETYTLMPMQGDYSTVLWEIGDSSVSSFLNHSVAPLLTTSYTLTTSNDSGCVKTDSVQIWVDSLSELSFSVFGVEDLKIGDTLSFKSLNKEPYHSYTWMIDSSVIFSQSDSAFWVPIYSGQYSLSLEGRNSLNCPITIDTTITVRDVFPRDYEHILYPNPTTGKFSYNFFSENEQKVIVTIVDEAGRILSSEQRVSVRGKNVFDFDITEAAMGKYYILLGSESGTQNVLRPWVIKLE
ncbi:FG-GAP repeat protein [Schleiferiaceae bacterium]|nr:FG-GAP repeat protein [Schleiferiaceae bacterium]